MPTFRTEITVRTKERVEIVDITDRVADACRESGVRDGMALVFPHHTSSAVYISDCDRALTGDFGAILSELAPEGRDYEHDRTDYKKNAAGHIRASLAGHHIIVPITGGRPDLGRFQTIYYAEFDGQREKEIVIKIVGE
ncbi:MAG: YjbQ family protein [Candidatus Hydrogenedentota bacterium]|nr:MAG: YjbQ family protein [Candidatus Hydrogenedentota bacterium]